MKKIFLHILLVCLAFRLSAQLEKRVYKDSIVKIEYHLEKGLRNGSYVSYYKNGRKKAEGSFTNNLRMGLWTVWDSTGRMRMQRNYTSVFKYTRVFPPIPKEGPIPLVSQDKYVPKRNADEYIDYAYLKEMCVAASKRVWRTIYKTNNNLLFTKNKLYDSLCKLVLIDSALIFKDEEFLEPGFNKVNFPIVEIIGFKIKEDWFFDKCRLISEVRILGICPIVRTGTKAVDTFDADLGWMYYPMIRKTLAAIKVSDVNNPAVTNLDDVFIYRYFSGEITKEANIGDIQISDYKKGNEIKKEVERIELSMIDWEHDIWMEFTK